MQEDARVAEEDPDQDVGVLVARLADSASAGRLDRRDLSALGSSMLTKVGRASVFGGRWLTDLFLDIAPRIPFRDLPALRAQHDGLDGDALADALLASAAKATATVGAAGGALATVEFAAPPLLLTVPAQIAAETLLVAAIEVKLLAELHEVYGRAAPGSTTRRSTAYLFAWTNRRGFDPLDPVTLPLSLGTAAKVALRRRLVRRAGRNLTTLGPMLTGAVAGSLVNHRETLRLGREIQAELRMR